MNELQAMTPDQMAELAARLRLRAKLFREAEPGSVIAGDMIRAANLIESMAQRVPLTDERLREIHHLDQFGLFCDYAEFEQIARAIEEEHGIRSEK